MLDVALLKKNKKGEKITKNIISKRPENYIMNWSKIIGKRATKNLYEQKLPI